MINYSHFESNSFINTIPPRLITSAQHFVASGKKFDMEAFIIGSTEKINWMISWHPEDTKYNKNIYFGKEISISAPQVKTTKTFNYIVEATAEFEKKIITQASVVVYPSSFVIKLLPHEASLTESLFINKEHNTCIIAGFKESCGEAFWKTTLMPGFYQAWVIIRSTERKSFKFSVDGIYYEAYTSGGENFEKISLNQFYTDGGNLDISIGKGWGWYEVYAIELLQIPAPSPPRTVSASSEFLRIRSAETAELLQKLASSYGNMTLTGQHHLDDIQYIEALTSKKPAILAFDFMYYSYFPKKILSAIPEETTEDFIARLLANNHIASIAWHWLSPMHAKSSKNPAPSNSPYQWWSSYLSKQTDFDLQMALTNIHSAEHSSLIKDIDLIAIELKKFQQANIPILWRPLHEPEGGWFWWGRSGSSVFKALWRLLFHRLSHYHNLSNLIWVLSSEDIHWYPGDDVVDIIGVDAYPDNQEDLLLMRWNHQLHIHDGKKIIALTEYGGVPDIDKMQKISIFWSFFISWYGEEGVRKSDPSIIKRIYHSSGVHNS